MNIPLTRSIWQQFGAAIDTLEDALNLCPDHLWEGVLWQDPDDARYGHFWFLAAHTVVWTDIFLSGSETGFVPHPPFRRGSLPEKPYTKEDILAYLRQCRQKAKSIIEALTDEKAGQICIFNWMEPTYLELQIYSMRHIQEHAAQLNFFLGHNGVTGQDWVAKARDTAS